MHRSITTESPADPAIGKNNGSPAARPRHWKGALRRRTATLSRWLHIYLSMASFAILFFFAATGITLNHTEWFAGRQQTVQVKGRLDRQWTAEPVAKLEIVEHLRKAHSVRGALSDFRVDEGQCSVSFKGPGYTADVFIDRRTGNYDLTEARMGFAAIINDLHKGRDSGAVWKAIIDVSAVLMCLVSLSGIVLIFFIQRRRFTGLVALAAGAVISYLIYVIWVP